MRILGRTETEADDNLPASGVVTLGLGLLVAVGMVLFSGIGAIVGHTVFDNVFGWGQDALVGAGIGFIAGVVFAFIMIQTLSSRLRSGGN